MSESQQELLVCDQREKASENRGEAIDGEWISRHQAENEDFLKMERLLHGVEMDRIETEMKVNQLKSLNKTLGSIGSFFF